MIHIKMNPTIAKSFVEMGAAGCTGKLYEDYYKSRPVLGKTKLKDFAPQFAEAYKKYFFIL